MSTQPDFPMQDQIELVNQLLVQQDEVLSQLDDLNNDIESLIDELAQQRKAELGIEDEDDNSADSGNLTQNQTSKAA